MRKTFYGLGTAAMIALLAAPAAADEIITEMFLITKDGIGNSIGTVTAKDGPSGLVLLLDFSNDLSPGPHGFHVHANQSCEAKDKDGKLVAGLGAGGHFDPADTMAHLGPSGDGHLGDLPVLYVMADGDRALPVKHGLVAPRLTVSDIRGHAFIIHADGDNFRDEPKPLGGGGARVACGMVPK